MKIFMKNYFAVKEIFYNKIKITVYNRFLRDKMKNHKEYMLYPHKLVFTILKQTKNRIFL